MVLFVSMASIEESYFGPAKKAEAPKESSRLEIQRGAVGRYISGANQELGSGDFAKVVSREEDSFCVKVFKTGMLVGMSQEEVQKEFAIQEKLYSKGFRVPQLLGNYYFKSTNEFFIYMQKIEGFSLDRYINGEADLLENFNIDTFWADVDEEIKKMHTVGVMHNDLHPGNIILDDKTAKPFIIDFGQSKDANLKEGEELSEFATEDDYKELAKTRAAFDNWYKNKA